MPRKAFHIGIDLDIHAVTCPGVWLCPKGDTTLNITMLGASAHTKRLEPSFPLLFHESFHFRKTLTGITTLAGLQAELARRLVHIQLVQWQVHGCRCVLLAAFCSPLSELLYPQPASHGLVAGVDVDLLMETMPCFPGIIAPKIEVSTKVVIEEMVNYPLNDHSPTVVNHKTISSKANKQKASCGKGNKAGSKMSSQTRTTVNSSFRSRVRQKPVCHARPRVKCYYCKQRGERSRRTLGEGEGGVCVCGEADQADDTHYIPYCNRCGDVVEEHETKQGKIILKEGSQNTNKFGVPCACSKPQSYKSSCDCSLCRRYNSFFNNSTGLSPDSVFSQSTASPKWKNNQPSLPANTVICQCFTEKVQEIPTRLRDGNGHSRIGCSRRQTNLTDDNRDSITDHLKGGSTQEEEYRNMFKADLESHYKKLYERVSRRNNRRES